MCKKHGKQKLIGSAQLPNLKNHAKAHKNMQNSMTKKLIGNAQLPNWKNHPKIIKKNIKTNLK